MQWHDQVTLEMGFPAVLHAKAPIHLTALLSFLEDRQADLQALLLKQGALLFRGFSVNTPGDFSKVISALQLGVFVDYIGGDSPRDKITDNIYTSTEAPPEFHIPLHQELSFIKNHPRHIYFYCDVPPVDRGETIIGDARKIYHAVSPEVLEKFSSQSLVYTSRYYFKNKIMQLVNQWQRSHKSWIEVFETQDKSLVEEKCVANDFAWQWLSHDWLQIQQERPAITRHPVTHETVWFNQAHLYDFNPKLLGLKKFLASKLFYFKRSMRLHEVNFSNGHKIARSDLYHVMEVLAQNTVAFPWQKGDVLVLDNILAMHGRAPFSGKRRILTAMTS